MLHNRRFSGPCCVQTRVSKGVNAGQGERNPHRNQAGSCAADQFGSDSTHAISSSAESTMAKWLCLAM